jgi:hypothetical protein
MENEIVSGITENRPKDMQRANFDPAVVSKASLNQMQKAYELRYIEKVVESEEEQRLVDINMADFEDYDSETKEKATTIFGLVEADPEYFEKPGSDKTLIKPVMILQNIKTKKNEVKIKIWSANYNARLVEKIKSFKREKSLFFKLFR